MRYFPDIFNPKVYAIEELNDLKTLPIIDQLLGTLNAYEMRISKDKSTTREASFKADKNIDSEMDVIEAKFVRLKKGSGKYKSKMPFKCFNCGKIGHFASKCHHKQKGQTSDDEENYTFKKFNNEAKYKKKSLCANDVYSSEEIDNYSSCEDKVNNFMLMAIEYFENEYT